MTAVDRSGLDPAYFDTMAAHATTHWWYRARSEWVTQELGGRAPGGTALDVGCGVGATLRALRSAGYDKVLGLDVSPYVLSRARDVVGGQPLLAVADAEGIPVADGALRCVASLDVLEHLADDVAALREYARVVARAGACS
jgi:ubiquinone/menaquinone biosynthesis C-methylase UbiE